jgi:hypothetical protein
LVSASGETAPFLAFLESIHLHALQELLILVADELDELGSVRQKPLVDPDVNGCVYAFASSTVSPMSIWPWLTRLTRSVTFNASVTGLPLASSHPPSR